MHHFYPNIHVFSPDGWSILFHSGGLRLALNPAVEIGLTRNATKKWEWS